MPVETAPSAPAGEGGSHPRAPRGIGWSLAVAGLLAGALALRLWGIKWGLPFTYNLDERRHFVPTAVGYFSGDLNPHYQLNPPGYSYVTAAVYALWFHSADAVRATYANDPTEAFLVARVTSAVLGTAAVGLTYLAGARLLGRPVGLLAGALLAVAYMPTFYAHQAINDAPTLAPVALSLFGAARALRRGNLLDYAIAGLGAGLAAGFKYNAGIVLLAFVAAAAVQLADRDRRRAFGGLAVGGIAAAVGFLLADPYAVLDASTFRDALRFLVDYNARERLVGETQTSGWAYYAWTLTWGLGWIPLLLAVAGAVMLVWRDRRAALVLVPIAVLFFVYMGSQGRYFGRYMLPMFPVLCLLAAYAGVQLATWMSTRWPRLAVPVAVSIVAIALGQGLVTSIHSDVILARKDTRTQLREWMEANVPPRSRIVMEPTVPRGWLRDGGLPTIKREAERWDRWRRTGALQRRLGRRHPEARVQADFQNFVRTLFPAMIDVYRSARACWYISSSTQRGRAFAEPARVPQAIAFYRALEREATVAHEVSPFPRDADPLKFQFDFSFNYYPRRYQRPGPVMTVYRLKNCR